MLKVISAVAGAGKTTFIVNKILKDIGEQGGRYMVISFQKADRYNFINRLEEKGIPVVVYGSKKRGITNIEVEVNGKKGEVWLTNLHALAYQRMKDVEGYEEDGEEEQRFAVLDKNKDFWNKFMSRYGKSFEEDIYDFPDRPGDILLSVYNFMQNKGLESFHEVLKTQDGYALVMGFEKITGMTINEGLFLEFLKDLKTARKNFMVFNGRRGVFFSEMLKYLEGVKPVDFSAIFVDEAQDVPEVALKYFVEWAKVCDVYVVGDVNQRIFGWSGTAEDFVDKLENLARKEGVECVIKRANYTHRLIGWIEELIKDFRIREEKMMYRVDKASWSGFQTGRYMLPILILVRNRAIQRALGKVLTMGLQKVHLLTPDEEEELKSARIALYRMESGKEKQDDFKKIVRFLRIENDKGIYDFEKILSDKDNYRVSLLKGETPYAVISTVHKAKGREADTVLIVNQATKNTRYFRNMFYHLEKPVLYVAFTRHRKLLNIRNPKKREHEWFNFVDLILRYNAVSQECY